MSEMNFQQPNEINESKNNNKFIVNATSKEGYIEGIEYKNIIGVQFHPELLDDNLFKYFIKECKRHKL